MKNRNAIIYAGAWGIIVVVTLIDCLWASRAGFTFGRGWPSSAFAEISCAFVASAVLSGLGARDRYRSLTHALRCKEFAVALLCMITIAVWGQAASVASYLGISLNVPTITDGLDRFDKAIGFDWLDTYHWVATHRVLRIVFEYAYWSAFAQLFIVPASLAIARYPEDITEFLVIMFVSSILLLLISIPFPAESAFVYYGVTDPGTASSVSDFALLRSGALRVINPYGVQGLVSMPSFHTMLAIFLAYSVRHVRFVFPAAIALNAVMIASTITVGGHYLADVFAGILCGAAVILAVRLGFYRQSAKRDDGGSALDAPEAGSSSSPVR